mgnify:CR=1 FL=1
MPRLAKHTGDGAALLNGSKAAAWARKLALLRGGALLRAHMERAARMSMENVEGLKLWLLKAIGTYREGKFQARWLQNKILQNRIMGSMAACRGEVPAKMRLFPEDGS